MINKRPVALVGVSPLTRSAWKQAIFVAITTLDFSEVDNKSGGSSLSFHAAAGLEKSLLTRLAVNEVTCFPHVVLCTSCKVEVLL